MPTSCFWPVVILSTDGYFSVINIDLAPSTSRLHQRPSWPLSSLQRCQSSERRFKALRTFPNWIAFKNRTFISYLENSAVPPHFGWWWPAYPVPRFVKRFNRRHTFSWSISARWIPLVHYQANTISYKLIFTQAPLDFPIRTASPKPARLPLTRRSPWQIRPVDRWFSEAPFRRFSFLWNLRLISR